MKKRLVAFVLILACIFALSACASQNINGDYSDVRQNLIDQGYNVVDLETPYQYEILSCLHATMYVDGELEEVYVIYCSSSGMANSVYEYVKNKYNHEKSELEMKEKILEYGYKTADIDSEAKVEHYSNYLSVKEQLERYDRYSYGRNVNMVWYGTKQAIADTNG